MAHSGTFAQGFQHLRRAKDMFESFIRDYPQARPTQTFRGFVKRIDWMFNEAISLPSMPDQAREGLKKELESDIWCIDALHEKFALLRPEQREILEDIIEKLLSGETLTVEGQNY